MNKANIGGIVRAALAAFAGYAAGKDWFPADLPLEEIGAAITVLVTCAWSVAAKKPAQPASN